MVECPICERLVPPARIGQHVASGCQNYIIQISSEPLSSSPRPPPSTPRQRSASSFGTRPQTRKRPASSVFETPLAKRHVPSTEPVNGGATPGRAEVPSTNPSPFLTWAQRKKRPASSFFETPLAKRHVPHRLSVPSTEPVNGGATPGCAEVPSTNGANGMSDTGGVGVPPTDGANVESNTGGVGVPLTNEANGKSSTGGVEVPSTDGVNGIFIAKAAKRKFGHGPGADVSIADGEAGPTQDRGRVFKKAKTNRSVPLAERMRPQTFDDIFGQDLVAPNGVLRSLIEQDRTPSMILWGGSGTGKTTIARCMARMMGSRFIELNATSSGVAECLKLFAEAENELRLPSRRKTIIFCDEIHRLTKVQQAMFLGPVEAGTITLIGATTENPSFKVVNALLSRCRTFTLQKLATEDISRILVRALEQERSALEKAIPSLVDAELVTYLATSADGDARTALNLLELALSLSTRENMTKADIKSALSKTLVHDRAGDQNDDTISAFAKSVRGSDADATLYYLARMLQSGEHPLFIARRMVVIASEDVGLADNSMLPLATATYTATQQLGGPEARIPLAHCAVALALAPKSTRAYRGLTKAYAAMCEPGVASLPVPIHLRKNAPRRPIGELGHGGEYKHPPHYRDGKVRQDYLPADLLGRTFLEDRHLGTAVDPDMFTTEGD